MGGTIVWKTVQRVLRWTFAPVGEPEPPDHPPRWVMRNGVPDLCCEQHRFVRQEPPWTGRGR